jgi:uncharacterized protein (DUF1015 family)
VPTLRPFRALRYEPRVAPDAGAVICPPYDVISGEQHEALLARDPHNAVRLELPQPPEGAPSEARYKEAAKTFIQWRTGGILAKERTPSVYVYEQRYVVPGQAGSRTQRGIFVRLKLEPFGPGSGVLPHERTLSGPKEDRFALLKATGANFSAVAGLYRGGHATTGPLLDQLTSGEPDAEGIDADGVEHRLWAVRADDAGDPERSQAVAGLLAAASAGPITIADGHHRYETALRYREERGANRACESDPGYDYVLALLYDVDDEPLTVLPTHRLVHGGLAGEELLGAAAAGYDVERLPSRDALLTEFQLPEEPSAGRPIAGSGRFGVWSDGLAAILRPRAADEGLDLAARLDVSRLGEALESLLGIDRGAVAGGGRLSYVHDAGEAVASVDRSDATTAFLLDPTPVEAVLEVAAAGGVMPQKSTFFYPKAACGLVFSPLEW